MKKELTQEELDSIEKSNQEQIEMFNQLDQAVNNMDIINEILYTSQE